MNKSNLNKNNKTTKVQFELFKKECEFWIDHFGLKGWHVEYIHQNHDDGRACCGWKISGRIANITLSTEWEDWRKEPITENDIKRSAFHEVCELLLSRLSMMAKNRIANHDDVVDEEVHNIIRTLENTIFKRSI